MFIIRDMVSGALLGEPFNGTVSWYGYPNSICQNATQHGLVFRPGEVTLQKVYKIEEIVSGSGSVVTYGAPTYVNAGDKVTRTKTFSQSQADIDAAALVTRVATFVTHEDFVALLNQLKTLTPAQLETNLTNALTNAGTLGQTKVVVGDYLHKIILVLAYLIRSENP